jgi:hypothetical protein
MSVLYSDECGCQQYAADDESVNTHAALPHSRANYNMAKDWARGSARKCESVATAIPHFSAADFVYMRAWEAGCFCCCQRWTLHASGLCTLAGLQFPSGNKGGYIHVWRVLPPPLQALFPSIATKREYVHTQKSFKTWTGGWGGGLRIYYFYWE